MGDRALRRLLQIACALLAAWALFGFFRPAQSPAFDSLARLLAHDGAVDPAPISGPAEHSTPEEGSIAPASIASGPLAGDSVGATRPDPAATAEPPATLPAAYQPIVTSGILGLVPAPKPRPPQLLGLLGKGAIIGTPGGKTRWLVPGEEFDGVRLVEFRTNRAVVEHAGKRHELIIHQGLGSDPIIDGETPDPAAPSAASGAATEERQP